MYILLDAVVIPPLPPDFLCPSSSYRVYFHLMSACHFSSYDPGRLAAPLLGSTRIRNAIVTSFLFWSRSKTASPNCNSAPFTPLALRMYVLRGLLMHEESTVHDGSLDPNRGIVHVHHALVDTVHATLGV